MATHALLVEVRFLEGRYHGNDDWPPSPFRLFQALIAGAYGGRWVSEPSASKDEAFRWLERLDPPHIASPHAHDGARVPLYVPNNDLDSLDGDWLRIADIRVEKLVAPRLVHGEALVLYAWPFDSGEPHAAVIARVADRMHTLGLGIDASFACAEVVSWDEAEGRLAAHPGYVIRPSGPAPIGPTCPTAGSFESLRVRFRNAAKRFRADGKQTLYANAPKPRLRQIGYVQTSTGMLFHLVGEVGSWPIDKVVELTERVRDAAAEKLKRHGPPNAASTIDGVIVGHRGASATDMAKRVRIAPLPSIGHLHADRAIRRILIEVPRNCPLSQDDLKWAFSVPVIVSNDGEVRCELAPTYERGMLAHYGIDQTRPARLWRTVTPAALPALAARRRIDPARRIADAKGGKERAEEEGRAIGAVLQAFRHAGLGTRPTAVRVQREPFEVRGSRAEAFASGTRFAKERLWHVEVVLADPLTGPLVIGDGRYVGLGLMAPVTTGEGDVFVFMPESDVRLPTADRVDLLRAVRRALMSLARDDQGNVPLLFSGHEPDGTRAMSGRHRHVFVAAADLDGDGTVERLIVAAPWACDRSVVASREERADFERVVSSLKTVRAGRLGVVQLRSLPDDPKLLGSASTWVSHTAFRPTRHAGRDNDAAGPLVQDAIAECERRGLPRPDIDVLDLSVGPNEGVHARLRLRFAVAVAGPILLGRNSHTGGGLFETV